jgi:DNA-binding CsgD family transcriptional regulator
VPLRIWALAVLASIISFYLAVGVELDPWRASRNTLADGWGGTASLVSTTIWVLAPLIAVRRPGPAVLLALTPFAVLSIASSETHEWPFATYTALLGIAMVAPRTTAGSWLVWASAALVPPATYLIGWTVALLPYNTRVELQADSQGLGYRTAVFLMYLAFTLFLVWLAGWKVPTQAPGADKREQQQAVPRPTIDNLTRRENEVFGLVAQGLTNREIAEQLVVGTETIKSHVAEVLRKLNLRDRSAAVIYAFEHGLVPGPPLGRSEPGAP